MDRNIKRAFIGVGSNIRPERNITDALLRLSKHVDITGIHRFTKPHRFYETTRRNI